MNHYSLVVKGEAQEALRETLKQQLPAKVESVKELPKGWSSVVKLSSEEDLTNQLNDWFLREHREGTSPPFPTGSLLYWRPIPPPTQQT